MREEGIGFDEIFTLKNTGRSINVSGARITGSDGNLYCDILWFRDLSDDVRHNRELEAEKQKLQDKVHLLEKMLDTLALPIWMRNEDLEIISANRAYMQISGTPETSEHKKKSVANDIVGHQTAQTAVRDNKMCRTPLTLVNNGKAYAYEVFETPCRIKDGLEKNGTVGMLEDMSELVEVKRNFEIHQTAHLEILSALGTAFALFDNRQKLIFYNKAFAGLWNLKSDFLDSNPSYGAFLDEARRVRLLPEVCDYQQYKAEEEKQFHDLLSAKETLLHIPDGRTFKRMAVPYPNGLIFAYEDVSDRLAATRMINQLASVQQTVLDQMRDAVIIFAPDQQLQYCNKAYLNLWKTTDVKLRRISALDEILEGQKNSLKISSSWTEVKQSMMRHILALREPFMIERSDGQVLEVSPLTLPDDSVMITYKSVSL
jgi:PAS domain-containing protein